MRVIDLLMLESCPKANGKPLRMDSLTPLAQVEFHTVDTLMEED